MVEIDSSRKEQRIWKKITISELDESLRKHGFRIRKGRFGFIDIVKDDFWRNKVGVPYFNNRLVTIFVRPEISDDIEQYDFLRFAAQYFELAFRKDVKLILE